MLAEFFRDFIDAFEYFGKFIGFQLFAEQIHLAGGFCLQIDQGYAGGAIQCFGFKNFIKRLARAIQNFRGRICLAAELDFRAVIFEILGF